MGTRKRPKLTTRYDGPRAGPRDVVSLDGRCEIAERGAFPVAVLDLDAGGCRISGLAMAVSKADQIRLWLGPLGPFGARLRWTKNGSAGLKFDEPLSEGQLAEALEVAVPEPAPLVAALGRRISAS